MNKEQIVNIISDIMINDGPDGYCDGSDIIADFVEALFKIIYLFIRLIKFLLS